MQKKKWPLSFSLITAALKGHFISVLGSIILHTSHFYRFDTAKLEIHSDAASKWMRSFASGTFPCGVSLTGLLGARQFFSNYCFPLILNCLVPVEVLFTSCDYKISQLFGNCNMENYIKHTKTACAKRRNPSVFHKTDWQEQKPLLWWQRWGQCADAHWPPFCLKYSQ